MQSNLPTRHVAEDSTKRVVVTLGDIGIAFWAVVFLGILGITLVTETRLFTNHRFDGFWDAVLDYHLNPDARPTVEKLTARFDAASVQDYMIKPRLKAAYLPSDKAAFVNTLTYSLGYRDKPILSLAAWLAMLVVFYWPIALTLRLVQRVISNDLCRSVRAREARADYFSFVDQQRWGSIALVFLAVLVVSSISAYLKASDTILGTGIGLSAFALALTVLSYISGIYMRTVRYGIDLVFLARGINPQYMLVDEFLALVIVGVPMYFVFQNSWLTIASSAAAGLGSGFYTRWRRGPKPVAKIAT